MIDDGLAPLGWDAEMAGAAAALVPTAVAGAGSDGAARVRAGRVLRTHRVGFDVRTPVGREFVINRARTRDPMAAPATGDWVVVHDVRDVAEPVIAEVVPRRTALVRRDPADRAVPQVLAANADVVAVVQGADRPVNPRRLERQLTIAHGSQAEVVVVLTKADLPQAAEAVQAVRGAAPTVDVLVTAASDGTGIEALDDLTGSDRTLVLVGESGAGKSSLVNAVLGREAVVVGAVRTGDAKGRHTTTRRELLALPTGGALLDTPGVRAVGLWPGWADLDTVFEEITDAAARCRFADCTHDREPSCGVRHDVEDGLIDPARLDAWRQLGDELAATADQLDRKRWR